MILLALFGHDSFSVIGKTNLMGYNIADTTGFPAKYKFADVKKASMVVADTLEDNVKELHKFLYGADENYQPSPCHTISEELPAVTEHCGGECPDH